MNIGVIVLIVGVALIIPLVVFIVRSERRFYAGIEAARAQRLKNKHSSRRKP